MRLRDRIVAPAMAVGVAIVTAFASSLETTARAPSPPRQSTAPAVSREEPIQEANDRFVRQLAEKLSGRGQQPSRLVFKNIKLAWFKEAPHGWRCNDKYRYCPAAQ